MRNPLLASAIAAVIGTSACAGEQPDKAIYACEYKSKKHLGNAEIELKVGQIQRVDYGNATKGLPGRPGFLCELSANRGEQGQKWQELNGILAIEFEDAATWGGNSIAISRDAGGFLIDMREAKSGAACGAGSSLPKSVYVPLKGKKCKFNLRQ